VSPLERSKQNARDFYRMAFLDGRPREAVERYVGGQYTQHNPVVADGKEPFIAYFERMAADYPEKSIEFVRVIAEGDLVVLHTRQTWPGPDIYATMDIFRFTEGGKIVEHWDVMQIVPDELAHSNGMF
jgi:predicted SnoaL-like aldol condensation-catalyzing enzyme